MSRAAGDPEVGGPKKGDAAVPAPGTAAIDAHVERIDGGAAERRFHPRPPNRLSRAVKGADFVSAGAIEAVALYRLEDRDQWHLVTYGLSELHDPRPGWPPDPDDSPEPEVAGWGFELTFRLGGEDETPLWAVDFLTSLAAYVRSSQHPFADGHNIDLRGPIHPGTDSAITAAMVVQDPELGVLAGPCGRVEFLQVVGLTAEELELCRSWSTEGVRDLLARDDPLLVTRVDRTSVHADPRWAEEVARRLQEEGSSLHELRVASLQATRRFRRGTVVEMGAGASSALGPALRRELVAPGARFSVVGDSGDLRFVVSTEPGWSGPPDDLEVAVPLTEVDRISALFDGRTGWGRLAEWPDLSFRIVK